MPSLLHLVRKLRGRSLAELRDRAEQMTAVWRERLGPVCEPALDGNVGADEGGRWPLGAAFFAGVDDVSATIAAMRVRTPGSIAAILQRADDARRGRFDLLGHTGLSFGDPIDWWLEPLVGIRSPDAHWSRIRYLDPRVVGDHKLVWELNRHQFLIALAIAEHLRPGNGDAAAAEGMLNAWMDTNPPGRGVNWASSLEVSFRALAWLWVLALLGDRLAHRTRARMRWFLRHAALHIERFLSTWFSPNTHLTGEALGLLAIGTLLPALPEAVRWRERGAGILLHWLPRHVQGDGVYVEQSTWYHRYTFDIYLHAALLLQRGGGTSGMLADLREHAIPVLGRMAEFMAAIMRPDGTMPIIGDDDGGKLVMLDERRPEDVRTPLAIAALLSGRHDLAGIAGAPSAELLWLLGPDAATALERLPAGDPAFTSRAFRHGGFFVIRDGWSRDASVCTVDCGPHGFMNAGHAHADALAIDLTLRGRPVFVDPGTFTYTLNPVDRDAFRHTGAHNAVTVDGASSSRMAGPFQWGTKARSELGTWDDNNASVIFRGRHDGFDRAATCERTVALLDASFWMVRDVIVGVGNTAHEVAVNFQCAPGLEARVLGPREVAITSAGTRVASVVTVASDGRFELTDGQVSPAYGVRLPATRLRYAMQRAGRVVVTTFVAADERLAVTAARMSDRDEFHVGAGPGEWQVSVPDSGAVSCVRRSTGGH